MKYVFFGSPRFAEIVLKRLLEENFVPAALVCNPDRPAGRKKVITPPSTKTLITEAGEVAENHVSTKIFQPEKLDDAFIAELTALQPDFFVVAAFAKIISKKMLAIPHLGTLGTHPSLLPRHRGASPIQTALLNGDETTGVTIYKMGPGVDDGPIFAQSEWPIVGNEQYLQLEEELALLSGALLADVIPNFFGGKISSVPQDETRATITKKFTTQDGFIGAEDLKAAITADKDKATAILRTINAFNPEPGCWTLRDGKRVKLLEGALTEKGSLKLTAIQEEGQKIKRL